MSASTAASPGAPGTAGTIPTTFTGTTVTPTVSSSGDPSVTLIPSASRRETTTGTAAGASNAVVISVSASAEEPLNSAVPVIVSPLPVAVMVVPVSWPVACAATVFQPLTSPGGPGSPSVTEKLLRTASIR